MRFSKTTWSALLICSALLGLTGCGEDTSSEPAETTAPIYVQEDEMQSATDTTSADTNSTEPEDTPPAVISEKENSTFDLDDVYNTSLAPNTPDNVKFEVTLHYGADYLVNEDSSISETIPFGANTSYADICNMEKFSLVPSSETLEYSVDSPTSSTKYPDNRRWEYFGIAHTTTDVPIEEWVDEYNKKHKVVPTIYLELSQSSDVTKDASSLVSTDTNTLVKAITAKSVRSNMDTDKQKSSSKIMLSFNVTTDVSSAEYEVGMWWDTLADKLKEQGLCDGDKEQFMFDDSADKKLVIKNSDYSLVFVKFGDYVDSISLIKN